MLDPKNSRSLTDEVLIADLRRAAGTWFKNSDLLALEELIRRYAQLSAEHEQSKREE
jgi:hypothetical protein